MITKLVIQNEYVKIHQHYDYFYADICKEFVIVRITARKSIILFLNKHLLQAELIREPTPAVLGGE